MHNPNWSVSTWSIEANLLRKIDTLKRTKYALNYLRLWLLYSIRSVFKYTVFVTALIVRYLTRRYIGEYHSNTGKFQIYLNTHCTKLLRTLLFFIEYLLLLIQGCNVIHEHFPPSEWTRISVCLQTEVTTFNDN